jgi:hypothetical protein
MLTRVLLGSLLVLFGAAAGGVSAQRVPVPIMGRVLDVTMKDGRRLQGELIEVDEQRLLLSSSSGLHDVELVGIKRVRARRHDFSGGKVLAWTTLGALVTGVGLASACAEVSDGCGGVFAGVALSWAIVGGLAGIGIAGSRWRDVPAGRNYLRPFARFPQGAPTGFSR